MLEILGIALLSMFNSKAAKARGRRGGAAVGYTIALWIGLEIVGAIIGAVVSPGSMAGAYVFGLVFALIGGGASAVIARLGEVRPMPQAPWGPGYAALGYPASYPPGPYGVPAPPAPPGPYQAPGQYGPPPPPPPMPSGPAPAPAPGQYGPPPPPPPMPSGPAPAPAPVPASIPGRPAPGDQPVAWQDRRSNGSTYRSHRADTLYAAAEALRAIATPPPNTYYVADTPDGSLGRDLFGFYTEAPLKTTALTVKPGAQPAAPVDAVSLTAFGDAMKSQASVAALKSAGRYASFVLQLECGHCGYKSPVETQEGEFERQCYSCGTVNKTRRGTINVLTSSGFVEI